MSAMALSVLAIGLQLAFLFCVSYAIITDFKTLLIPNWISLALIGVFAVFALFFVGVDAIGGHLFVMGIVLALAIAFFVAGWMGGGDVKFMSAMALWMGPEHIVPFVTLMALLGAALAISLIFLNRHGSSLGTRVQELPLVARLTQLARDGQCPYGVAIGVAGLLVSMQVFALAPA
jgi:prepilin peptidase CpaA